MTEQGLNKLGNILWGIADCLSSSDELITAYTQKHESLKAHKKGLMQQLFPSVDEMGEAR